MFNTLASMLISIVEMSSILSVISIIIFGMILLIAKNLTFVWLNGDDYTMNRDGLRNQHVPEKKMVKVDIPFVLKLHETSSKSFQEVRCFVSSTVSYKLLAFWGVSIRELHILLWKPWPIIDDAIKEDNLLAGNYQQKGLSVKEESHGDKVLFIQLPTELLELGTPPRLCYPLVIFLIRDTPGTTVHPLETVALIYIVHIQDPACTLPTIILAQYLKQANGHLSSLKQLFMAMGNQLALDEMGPEASDGEEQLCVVCRFFPLSRVLLPCRHTCICGFCFSRLKSCPLCRGPILSYFRIKGEEYLAEVEKNNSAAAVQWFKARIADFLRFRQ